MNSFDFLNSKPDLQRIIINSNLLNIIPGGFAIATDNTCKTIIHNPVSAKFLRIEPWEKFSHSSYNPPAVKVIKNGKPMKAEEMPMQRAAQYGEDVVGEELEFLWGDGVSKIARWSASALRDENGNICGCIATM